MSEHGSAGSTYQARCVACGQMTLGTDRHECAEAHEFVARASYQAAFVAARPASAEPVALDLFSGRPLNRTEVMDLTHMHSAIRVGRGLRDARLALDMTQADVARISGTTQAHVSMVEAAERNATLDVLSRMARAVGMVVTLAPALEQATPPAAAQDMGLLKALRMTVAVMKDAEAVRKTYTDSEEYRHQGAEGALEDVLSAIDNAMQAARAAGGE